MKKILSKDLIIPAGVFITDDISCQPISDIQVALDNYLRLLPNEYFEQGKKK